MALTPAELNQCKSWLGYGNLTASARPYFDIALVFEDVIVSTLDATWAEGYVRSTILVNLTSIDTRIQNQMDRRQASELVGEIVLNARELNDLLDLQSYWIDRLSIVLKVPRVPKPGGGSGSSVEVT